MDLPDRPALANKRGADFVREFAFQRNGERTEFGERHRDVLHHAGGVRVRQTRRVRGAITEKHRANREEQRSLLLAYQIHKSLTRGLLADDRGVAARAVCGIAGRDDAGHFGGRRLHVASGGREKDF